MSVPKEQVRERANERCRFCGMTNQEHLQAHGEQLHVHHVIPRRANGSDKPKNLICVCVSCHRTIEYTQSDALHRLNKKDSHEEEYDALRQERDALLERVEYLERLIRDPEFYSHILYNCTVDYEAVTTTVGDELLVTLDHQEAVDQYEEWGDQITRGRLPVHINLGRRDVKDRLFSRIGPLNNVKTWLKGVRL